MASRSAFVPSVLGMLLALAVGCGEEPTDDSGNEDGPAGSTSPTTMTGGGPGSTSMNTTSGTASNSGTTSTDDASADSTTAAPMGTMVESCSECSAQELCMVLTEFAGPADGGPPPMTSFCFPFPVQCGDTVDCGCAGHLCPSEEGAEGDCSVDSEVLRCSIAYP